MKIYTFGQAAGQPIHAFDSSFIMSRIVRTEEPAHIGCMHLEAGGHIGRHRAPVPQLLLIVAGEGQVTGEAGLTRNVYPGDAVFWEQDEWHDTKTESGLTAIVVESSVLSPAKLMPLKVSDV
ncbi:cupin domain-containing protein [Paenibacillus tepidiphilus]|uniref:cupin domain-containing protein n=1 Tax=Paenibacillus tepidiphilus TaxID=2608683 RepID=UPI00123C3504|nr:cupin domain-containing protein [Paenibacillus tepidiphilus]